MARALFSDTESGRRTVDTGEGLDITPMIDMTFLLLIFFMVSSTMQVQTRLQMPPALHGQGVNMDDSILITVLKSDAEPLIVQGGSPSGESMAMSDVGPYVAQGVTAGKATVIIKADRDVPSGFVEEIARTANEAAPADTQLTFFVGVQDKPQKR